MKLIKYISLISITLVLFGCGEVKGVSKTTSNFVYENSGKKVELVLENDAKLLVVGKHTRANFKTKNIDLKKVSIAASGIKLNKNDTDGFLYTITPNEEALVNGQLKIHFTESIKGEENFRHIFFVDVITSTKE